MGAKKVELLGTKLSPYSHRIEWALKLKGINYELQVEDLKDKSPLLLELNPVYKKIPVLVHSGKAISESLIILEYINDTWSNDNILPKDPLERANARLMANFIDQKLIVSANKALFSTGEEQTSALKSTLDFLQVLEAEIERNRRNLFGGETIGFVDIVLGWIYWFKFAEKTAGFKITNDLDKYPAVDSWFTKFLNVPLIKETLPGPSEVYRVCQIMQAKWLAQKDRGEN